MTMATQQQPVVRHHSHQQPMTTWLQLMPNVKEEHPNDDKDLKVNTNGPPHIETAAVRIHPIPLIEQKGKGRG